MNSEFELLEAVRDPGEVQDGRLVSCVASSIVGEYLHEGGKAKEYTKPSLLLEAHVGELRTRRGSRLELARNYRR